jgi:hypothetical protein
MREYDEEEVLKGRGDELQLELDLKDNEQGTLF